MYWVKNQRNWYFNLEHFSSIVFRKSDEGTRYLVEGYSPHEDTPYHIGEFESSEKAQLYLDDLVHKAMKGF